MDSIDYFKGDDIAADTWMRKYSFNEDTPDDMHKRLANEFARIRAVKYGTSQQQEFEKIYSVFKDFKYIVPQGSVMSVLGTDMKASISNCFVIGTPHDSYGGIMKKDQELVQLMKRMAIVTGKHTHHTTLWY